MAATAPQTLLTGGRCFDCYGASAVQMMRLSLLSNILTALNPMAATDPQSLLTYGKCFDCYGANGIQMMELALLDQILAAGGGGGGGTQEVFQDYAPGTPPTDPTKPALSFSTGGGTLFQWDVASQTWV